jgi:hypothetical protein
LKIAVHRPKLIFNIDDVDPKKGEQKNSSFLFKFRYYTALVLLCLCSFMRGEYLCGTETWHCVHVGGTGRKKVEGFGKHQIPSKYNLYWFLLNMKILLLESHHGNTFCTLIFFKSIYTHKRKMQNLKHMEVERDYKIVFFLEKEERSKNFNFCLKNFSGATLCKKQNLLCQTYQKTKILFPYFNVIIVLSMLLFLGTPLPLPNLSSPLLYSMLNVFVQSSTTDQNF